MKAEIGIIESIEERNSLAEHLEVFGTSKEIIFIAGN